MDLPPVSSVGALVFTVRFVDKDAVDAARFYAATFPNSEVTVVHDRYWNAIVNNGGQESQCGWCKDRWGLSWQITPRALTDALAAGGDEARRAFEAMMPMKKIDIATIEAARRG
jgi:predicted 3-demethylubiquinone-9 3-methyltransferase (glyoxalase superfamily)